MNTRNHLHVQLHVHARTGTEGGGGDTEVCCHVLIGEQNVLLEFCPINFT